MKQRLLTFVAKYRVRRNHFIAKRDLFLFRIGMRLHRKLPYEVRYGYRKCRAFLRYNFWNFPEA